MNRINPLEDRRWERLLARHPRASVYHTAGWLEALRRTYGYEPFALTKSEPAGEFSDAVVFCEVKSPVTGRRFVSLPFSDHCDPLTDSGTEVDELLEPVRTEVASGSLRYIELRPLTAMAGSSFAEAGRFWLHKVDLRVSIEDLFNNLHRSCVQRKLRRAERENVTCERGRSELLVRQFYQLLLNTRRRQNLPPQPLRWFTNLMACLGKNATIHLATVNATPVAGMLTLRFNGTCTYKYGCSDAQYRHMGGVQHLFWQAIEEAHRDGCREFDLGRTDCDNPGLATFKERLGGTRTAVTYWRYPAGFESNHVSRRIAAFAGRALARMPDRLFAAAGDLLYRHVG
jgi:hypothetical protein